jgi:hypothetical protein
MTARLSGSRLVLVVAAIALAVVADLATGALVPGRTALFSLTATFVLVLGSKRLARAGLQQPVGLRPGELPEEPHHDAGVSQQEVRGA